MSLHGHVLKIIPTIIYCDPEFVVSELYPSRFVALTGANLKTKKKQSLTAIAWKWLDIVRTLLGQNCAVEWIWNKRDSVKGNKVVTYFVQLCESVILEIGNFKINYFWGRTKE